jgi:hypothetical protein
VPGPVSAQSLSTIRQFKSRHKAVSGGPSLNCSNNQRPGLTTLRSAIERFRYSYNLRYLVLASINFLEPLETMTRRLLSDGNRPLQYRQPPYAGDRGDESTHRNLGQSADPLGQHPPSQPGRHAPGGVEDDRTHEDPGAHRRQPPMGIADALRSCCGINAKQVFVAAVGHDGVLTTFLSPGPGLQLPEDTISNFFLKNNFKEVVRGLDFGTMGHERHSSADDSDSSYRQTRKRSRGDFIKREDEDAPVKVPARVPIRIGDPRVTKEFYNRCLNRIQQAACKHIAKAWIKTVEPKKQSLHPYTGANEQQPDWWPRPRGTEREDYVRHKEPDHLHKRERLELLLHILELVITPHHIQQHDVQRQRLTVQKLQDVSVEALNVSFFPIDENNESKRPYLMDMFEVAKAEERYRAGGLDQWSVVYVTRDDDGADSSEQNSPTSGRGDELEWPRAVEVGMPNATETSPRTTIRPGRNTQGTSELPVRSNGPHFSGPPLPNIMTQQTPYVDGSNISNRRPSAVNDYSSNNINNAYSQTWQPISTSTVTSPLYTYSASHVSPSQSQSFGFVGDTVPLPSVHGYINSPFEASPRPAGEAHSVVPRSGEMHPPSSTLSPSYNSYAAEDGHAIRAKAEHAVDSRN